MDRIVFFVILLDFVLSYHQVDLSVDSSFFRYHTTEHLFEITSMIPGVCHIVRILLDHILYPCSCATMDHVITVFE